MSNEGLFKLYDYTWNMDKYSNYQTVIRHYLFLHVIERSLRIYYKLRSITYKTDWSPGCVGNLFVIQILMFAFEISSYYFYFIDIDECATDLNSCHKNATCKNTHGSFKCFCNDGFRGNGTTCTGKHVFKCNNVDILNNLYHISII